MDRKRRNIYHFNPGHDLALCNGSAFFVPPLAVQQMQYDLSLLPLWYAEKGGTVLSEDHEASSFVREVSMSLPSFECSCLQTIHPSAFRENAMLQLVCGDIHPWGWDKAERNYLLKCGVPLAEMPSDEALRNILNLSNRQVAVQLLSRLHLTDRYVGESYFLSDFDACLRFVQCHAACVFKAPLSGSGKGLLWYKDGIFSSPFERWCHRQLSTQGGVIAEPVYAKLYDMAVEVTLSASGKATFMGYSFFSTTPAGVYRYNLLTSDAYLSDTPCMQSISKELLPRLLVELEDLFGGKYIGCLGVDMMICADSHGEPASIHPCVEVNTRMTMGIAAHAIYNKYIDPESCGRFHIDYHRVAGEALAFHRIMQQKHPLQLNGGKIESGYLSLNPLYDSTHSHAWIIVGDGCTLFE